MLYDAKRWDNNLPQPVSKPYKRSWLQKLLFIRPSRYEAFEIHDFITWLGQQPYDKGYSYITPRNCAVAQYLKFKGCGGSQYSMGDPDILYPELGTMLACRPQTFGAARERVMKLL